MCGSCTYRLQTKYARPTECFPALSKAYACMQKGRPDDSERPSVVLFFLISMFPVLVDSPHCALTTALRSPLRRGCKRTYLSLPSPHIPIAAVAANRVIIIVINITFYL